MGGFFINKKNRFIWISIIIILLVITYIRFPRGNNDNRPFIEYSTIAEMQENLKIEVLIPTYIPKQIIYKETEINNHGTSIRYKTFKRKKQIGYGIMLGNHDLDKINQYEGKFNNLAVSCWLKDAINVYKSPENKIEEETEDIQGVSINKALIEKKQNNDRMSYWYRITFEYNGYEYIVMSQIYGYYTKEILQDIRTELMKVTESMLSQQK